MEMPFLLAGFRTSILLGSNFIIFGTERIDCFVSVLSYLDTLPVTKTRRDFAFHFFLGGGGLTQPVFFKRDCRCNLRPILLHPAP
jgi:hypothetical protein